MKAILIRLLAVLPLYQTRKLDSSYTHLMRFAFLLFTVCLAASAAMSQGNAPQPRLIDDYAITPRSYPVPVAVAVVSNNHAANPLSRGVRARVVNSSARTEVLATANYGDAAFAANARSMSRRAFDLLNRERSAKGLTPLQWDESAARMAEIYVLDMARRNFFNHVDPEGNDPGARARQTGVRGWRALGENIAVNRGYDNPVAQAVEGWLKSSKHRDNILQPFFTHAAIGIARDANGKYYFTQVFLTRG